MRVGQHPDAQLLGLAKSVAWDGNAHQVQMAGATSDADLFEVEFCIYSFFSAIGIQRRAGSS